MDTQAAGPHIQNLRVSGAGQGVRACTSDRFLDDSDVAGLGSYFKNHEAMSHCLSWLPYRGLPLFAGMGVMKTIPSTEGFMENPTF